MSTSELKMKSNPCRAAVALLLVVACNRPDSALFDSGPAAPVEAQGSAGLGGKTTGGTSADSGVTQQPSVAGNAPTAAGSGGVASNGAVTSPASGGADDIRAAMGGAAGAGELPTPEPACGNGVLEAGEQCDDAGHAGLDGCNSNCEVVCADFDPNSVESDDHHCYKGFDQGAFQVAQEGCVMRGGHLATISSVTENELVRSFVNNSKWVGGLEDVSATSPGTGDYKWVTGEPFTYTNWAQREPNRAKTRCGLTLNTCYEHCVSMLRDGAWSDASCEQADGYVCEWDPPGAK